MALGAGRLQRELREAQKNQNATLAQGKEPDVILESDPEHIFRWTAVITGPAETPFAGGKYVVTIRAPSDYPMCAPAASFDTRIFHPNVAFKSGEICLDILKDRWSPAWTMMSLATAIQALMADPYADSPLNCDAGNLVRAGDMRGYEQMARFYAITYAGAEPSKW